LALWFDLSLYFFCFSTL